MTKSEYIQLESWFKNRIGKKVYRNKNTCFCKQCETNYQEGIVIDDTIHAEHLAEVCVISEVENNKVMYFDTKDEVFILESTVILKNSPSNKYYDFLSNIINKRRAIFTGNIASIIAY